MSATQYTFTADPIANATVLKTNVHGAVNSLFDLSYYTLSKLAYAIHAYPTPENMAQHCKMAGAVNVVLTLDGLGNFISLKPTYT